MGDSNMDNELNILDIIITRWYIEKKQTEIANIFNVDYNQDGNITIDDLNLLRKDIANRW